MMDVGALYDAAASSGMLVPVTFGGVVVMADFRAPDEDVLDGLGVSRGYTLRYPQSRLTLKPGDELVVAAGIYRVREVTQLGDGSECRASLTRL
jgi:hypothetical protein